MPHCESNLHKKQAYGDKPVVAITPSENKTKLNKVLNWSYNSFYWDKVSIQVFMMDSISSGWIGI